MGPLEQQAYHFNTMILGEVNVFWTPVFSEFSQLMRLNLHLEIPGRNSITKESRSTSPIAGILRNMYVKFHVISIITLLVIDP